MFKRKLMLVLTAILSLTMAVPSFAAPAPFADVPAQHWSYDAISYLAANGIVDGYPGGYFKGDRTATRYEMAAFVAKALANVDATKADEQDVELLRKLALEFSDELAAMGVKVNDLDVRLAIVEQDLGGWSFAGSLTFDMNWGDDDANRHSPNSGSDNWNEFAEGNIAITRTFSDGSYVYGRFALDRNYNDDADGNEDVIMDRLFWQASFGSNLMVTLGRFEYDWEKDAMLVHPGENSGWLTNGVVDGIRGTYTAQHFDVDAVIARNIGFDSYPEKQLDDIDAALYAVKLGAYLSERSGIGVFYSYMDDDGDQLGTDISSYGGWLGWEFYPGAAVRGMYFKQDLDLNVSDPDAWKAVVDLNEQLLGFTSLWVEYGQIDQFFMGTTAGAYNWSEGYSSSIYKWGISDADLLLVRADQQWTDKWGTFVRYAQNDYDLSGADTITDWTVGVNYQMTPAIGFQLAYDEIDYGNMAAAFNLDDSKDRLIRFRTTINF